MATFADKSRDSDMTSAGAWSQRCLLILVVVGVVLATAAVVMATVAINMLLSGAFDFCCQFCTLIYDLADLRLNHNHNHNHTMSYLYSAPYNIGERR